LVEYPFAGLVHEPGLAGGDLATVVDRVGLEEGLSAVGLEVETVTT
jgi:hypothetical protein